VIVLLQNPKLTLRIGKDYRGTSDLSFLKLTNVNLTLKNFSSKTGGSIAFQATFAFTTGGETAIAANGTVKGSIQLASVYPKPYGKGSVELAVDSGSQAGDKRTISLSGLTLATDLVYDQRTETFAITARRQRRA